MTSVDFYQGSKVNLPLVGENDGSLYITNDTGELYKSTGLNSELIKIGDIITGYANLEALQLANPQFEKKLYFTDDNNIYKSNGTSFEAVSINGSNDRYIGFCANSVITQGLVVQHFVAPFNFKLKSIKLSLLDKSTSDLVVQLRKSQDYTSYDDVTGAFTLVAESNLAESLITESIIVNKNTVLKLDILSSGNDGRNLLFELTVEPI